MIIRSYDHIMIMGSHQGHPLQKRGISGNLSGVQPLHFVEDRGPHPLHRTHPLHLSTGLDIVIIIVLVAAAATATAAVVIFPLLVIGLKDH